MMVRFFFPPLTVSHKKTKQAYRCIHMVDPPGISLSCSHTHKSYYLVTVNMRWAGCLGVISGCEGVKGMCVPVWFLCAVLCLIDILPHSCPVGHSRGRQMAVFRSTAGQHMAPRDKVCVCVCETENLTLQGCYA